MSHQVTLEELHERVVVTDLVISPDGKKKIISISRLSKIISEITFSVCAKDENKVFVNVFTSDDLYKIVEKYNSL
jgi:hypothetical protein